MPKESEFGLAELTDDTMLRIITETNLSKNQLMSALKAYIAGGDKLVNGYYYFQDANSPQVNDWRMDANDTIYFKIQRFDGPDPEDWVTAFTVGGSARTEGKVIIDEEAVADLLVQNPDGTIQNLIRKATWSSGTVLGDVGGSAYIVINGDIIRVDSIEPESWKIVQSDDSNNSTGTNFYVDNTTLATDGFIASKVKIKGVSIPEGAKAQLKIFRQSDLSNPIWQNVTDKELQNGAGATIDSSTGEILLNPKFNGIGSQDVRLVVNTKDEITLKGSNTEGTDVYFESFDATVTFTKIGIHGNCFQKFESKAESSTTLASLQEKLAIETTELQPGIYEIEFKCDATNDSSKKITNIEFSINGSSIHQHDNGPGLLSQTEENADSWWSCSGKDYVELLTVGTIVAAIKYSRGDGGTARISNAIITVKRVI